MAGRASCWTTCSAAGSPSPGSDQGRSFQAFYGFLLSQARQEELALLDRVHSLAGIAERDARLRHIHYDWLDAAERTQATVRQLSEQLRRFLDDQVWFENRRVIDILRSIESRALQLRETGNVPVSLELDAPSPALRLPLERPLYVPVKKARLSSDTVRDADEETDPAVLFEQVYVDPEPLRGGVRQALRRQPQVGLAELVAQYPLKQGAAELVTYLSLQDEAFAIVYDERQRDEITWSAADGRERTATLPRVTYAEERRMTAEPRPFAGCHPAHEGCRVPGYARPRVAQPARATAAGPGLRGRAGPAGGHRRCGRLRVPPPAPHRSRRRRPTAPADPAPSAVISREPAARAAAQEAGRVRRPGCGYPADAEPGTDNRDDPRVSPGDQQRSPAHRPARRAHQQGRRAWLPAGGQEHRAGSTRCGASSRPSWTGSGSPTSTPGSPNTPPSWKGKTRNDRLPPGSSGAVQLGHVRWPRLVARPGRAEHPAHW